jgi:hypothetical protein
MLFNAFYPLIEFLVFWGLRVLFRAFDRPCCSPDSLKTKKTSINSYIQIYVGPLQYMHFKYSAILNICFVTMMFGFGMPLLFPVAATGFAILYVVENLMLYYAYQQPPLTDEKLDASVLNFLKFAPLVFLAFGYWMVSSKQLLANDVFVKEYSSDTPRTGHLYNDPFTRAEWNSPAWPMLAMFFVLILVLILERIGVFHQLLRIKNIEIVEEMGNYFESLAEQDRRWSVMEEEYARANLEGLQILTDEALAKLKDKKLRGKPLQGIHSYDILANPAYSESFNYVSVSVPDRNIYIIDGDSDEENDAV